MIGIVASSEAESVLFTTVDLAAVEAEAIQKLVIAVAQNAADFVAPADDPADYQKLLAIAGRGIA